MRETRELEYKSEITNTFLKTVSAFANYQDGTIIFGITDNGEYIGIENISAKALDIENRINDSIKPIPNYQITLDESNNAIRLRVFKGINIPYLYK